MSSETELKIAEAPDETSAETAATRIVVVTKTETTTKTAIVRVPSGWNESQIEAAAMGFDDEQWGDDDYDDDFAIQDTMSDDIDVDLTDDADEDEDDMD